ncbi:MAG TPA: nucleotide sugar dehydrogenase, partial [Pyrinomonadaceae bacterium]|nr:nucleotide sugar dehydrogenase [Pyrinomonadaceae bacterium]
DPNSSPAASALEPLVGVDIFIVCVPTPLDPKGGWAPDTQWIKKAAKLICHVCEQEQKNDALPHERLMVLESTTYPGTTREIFGAPFDKFRDGREWSLAYSPERINPSGIVRGEDGVPPIDPAKIKRIVGGLNKPDRDNAVALYKKITTGVEEVDSLEAAELVKLVENTFRFVAIGFANEMSQIARNFGLNIWEIIAAAKTKKFGLDMCDPGLIGGHCIPIDPHYLNWSVRNQRHMATFIDVAEKAHQEMKRDALELIQRLLNQNHKGVSGRSILFLGVAYKENVGDTRESAIVELMKRLHSSGANVSFWDPVRASHSEKDLLYLKFNKDEYELLPPKAREGLEESGEGSYRYHPNEEKGRWEDLREKILSSPYDCIVISTNHDEFRFTFEELIMHDTAPPLADLRNAIPQWLLKAGLPKERIEELQQKVSLRSKYMLLGVH